VNSFPNRKEIVAGRDQMHYQADGTTANDCERLRSPHAAD
jgi:hypothetical protein